MNIAFKEWAIVIDALGRGSQIFILRKGGIREGRGGFKPEHERFLLFPTLFHQQRDSVIASAQRRYDEIAPGLPSSDAVRIQFWAELIEAHHIEDFAAIQRLAGQHIWREEVLQDRFAWGRERAIYALALRVYRFATAVTLPMLPQYGGCKSWVSLDRSFETTGTKPVLNEAELGDKLAQARSALGGPT